MYVSIDMGGTNTRVASSRNLNSFLAVKKFRTKHSPDLQKRHIAEAIQFVTFEEPLDDMVIGVPGVFDNENKKFIKISNIESLDNQSFDTLLEYYSKYHVENDAVLAALGEAKMGAGRSFDKFGYLTLGTGVGGCIVENNAETHITRREPGHQIILSNEKTFEETLSGRGFYHLYGESSRTVYDPAIWKEYADNLAEAIKKVSKEWDLRSFVLGGNITIKYDLFGPRLHEVLPDMNIQKCDLQDNSGICGGLVYLKSLDKLTIS